MPCQPIKEAAKEDVTKTEIVSLEKPFIAFWQDGFWWIVEDNSNPPVDADNNSCYSPVTNQEEPL